MGNISVGIFDDNEIFAYGAAAILRDDPQVASIIRDLDDAPGIDVAVTSVGYVGHAAIDCPVIACASSTDVTPATHNDGRVAALLYRDEVTPDQLCSAVHAAAAGLRIHWEQATSGVLDERGRAVLRLIAGGAGTREISTKLGYSERTIKGAIQQLEQALGARSRAHAVAVAMRSALI